MPLFAHFFKIVDKSKHLFSDRIWYHLAAVIRKRDDMFDFPKYFQIEVWSLMFKKNSDDLKVLDDPKVISFSHEIC